MTTKLIEIATTKKEFLKTLLETIKDNDIGNSYVNAHNSGYNIKLHLIENIIKPTLDDYDLIKKKEICYGLLKHLELYNDILENSMLDAKQIDILIYIRHVIEYVKNTQN